MPQAMSCLDRPIDRRSVVLYGVSWGLYQEILAEIHSGAVRLTYDHGSLDIARLFPPHGRVSKGISRLIETYADEEQIGIEGLGSTTFCREEFQVGLEPDACYYIAHAANVIGKDTLDLGIDPPPDLVIEVDISPPGVAKLPIYAAVRVPEVWRYDGQHLAPMRLRRGHYVKVRKSIAFPSLPMNRLNEFLAIGLASGQTAAVRALRAWLRGR